MMMSSSLLTSMISIFSVVRGLPVNPATAMVFLPNSAASTATSTPNPRGYLGTSVNDGRRSRFNRRYPSTWSRDVRLTSMTLPKLPSRSASVALFVAGMVLGCCVTGPVSASFRLYRTVPDIPKAMFQEHASVWGTVVSVSDGDSIRVRHKPTLPLPGRKMEGKRSEETLQIRLYAVDCPEVAHFGNPAQPFSEEAKQFTKGAVEGQRVRLKLLRMDQYKRAVCKVEHGRWPFRKDVSAELLERGLGVLYRQGGAEYDGQKERLARLEAQAKEGKKGLWKQASGETPAQYKARIKRDQAAGAAR